MFGLECLILRGTSSLFCLWFGAQPHAPRIAFLGGIGCVLLSCVPYFAGRRAAFFYLMCAGINAVGAGAFDSAVLLHGGARPVLWEVALACGGAVLVFVLQALLADARNPRIAYGSLFLCPLLMGGAILLRIFSGETVWGAWFTLLGWGWCNAFCMQGTIRGEHPLMRRVARASYVYGLLALSATLVRLLRGGAF